MSAQSSVKGKINNLAVIKCYMQNPLIFLRLLKIASLKLFIGKNPDAGKETMGALNGVIDSVGMGLRKFWVIVKDREARLVAACGIATRLT